MNKVKRFKKNLSKCVLMTIPIALIGSFGCSNKEVEYVEEIDLNDYMDKVDDISVVDPNYKIVILNNSDITDDTLDKIPSYIEELHLYDCYFITDLSNLPYVCPNLKNIYITNCSSLTDLDFVYDFNYLECFKIYGSAYVNENLVNYLDNRGIRHNIEEDDLKIAHEIDSIVDSIIDDNMSDTDKVRAITLYLMDNFEYDEALTNDSNFKPLETMLNNKRGVCAGYAYLANVMLRKANVDAYEVINADHAWNLVREDDKYYYLDVTNLDTNGMYFSVKHFDNAPTFLSDPKAVNLTGMTAYDEGFSKVIIPKSLVEDINRGEELKSLYEKYGTDFITFYLKYALVPITVMVALDTWAIADLHKKKKEEKNKKR